MLIWTQQSTTHTTHSRRSSSRPRNLSSRHDTPPSRSIARVPLPQLILVLARHRLVPHRLAVPPLRHTFPRKCAVLAAAARIHFTINLLAARARQQVPADARRGLEIGRAGFQAAEFFVRCGCTAGRAAEAGVGGAGFAVAGDFFADGGVGTEAGVGFAGFGAQDGEVGGGEAFVGGDAGADGEVVVGVVVVEAGEDVGAEGCAVGGFGVGRGFGGSFLDGGLGGVGGSGDA